MTHDAMTPSKVWDLIEGERECFFVDVDRNCARIRPMGPLIRRDEGRIWFVTDRESHKVDDLRDGSPVSLVFGGSGADFRAVLTGAAILVDDRATVRELWSDVMKQWFDGPEDPRIVLICFDAREAETWTGPGRVMAAIKLAYTAFTGRRTEMGSQQTTQM
jgi:general stress protein 26